jgi:hypothetical protein
MLILDASGQQRRTYEYWQRHRGGVIALKSPEKSYKDFTVHHWDIGSGKASQRRRAPDIAFGIAKAINREIPAEEGVLVITFKPSPTQPDMKKLISDRITFNRDRVKFTTWGMHTATNEFANCKYVILAGILQYSTAEYEAYGLAAKAQDINKPLTEQEFKDVRIGEIAHHILQAACRGTVRKAEGDRCPPGCHLYIVYRTYNGIPGAELMQQIFPSSSYEVWMPIFRLSKKDVKLAEHLENLQGLSILKATLRDSHGVRSSRLMHHLRSIKPYFKSKGTVLDWDAKRVYVKPAQAA